MESRKETAYKKRSRRNIKKLVGVEKRKRKKYSVTKSYNRSLQQTLSKGHCGKDNVVHQLEMSDKAKFPLTECFVQLLQINTVFKLHNGTTKVTRSSLNKLIKKEKSIRQCIKTAKISKIPSGSKGAVRRRELIQNNIPEVLFDFESSEFTKGSFSTQKGIKTMDALVHRTLESPMGHRKVPSESANVPLRITAPERVSTEFRDGKETQKLFPDIIVEEGTKDSRSPYEKKKIKNKFKPITEVRKRKLQNEKNECASSHEEISHLPSTRKIFKKDLTDIYETNSKESNNLLSKCKGTLQEDYVSCPEELLLSDIKFFRNEPHKEQIQVEPVVYSNVWRKCKEPSRRALRKGPRKQKIQATCNENSVRNIQTNQRGHFDHDKPLLPSRRAFRKEKNGTTSKISSNNTLNEGEEAVEIDVTGQEELLMSRRILKKDLSKVKNKTASEEICNVLVQGEGTSESKEHIKGHEKRDFWKDSESISEEKKDSEDHVSRGNSNILGEEKMTVVTEEHVLSYEESQLSSRKILRKGLSKKKNKVVSEETRNKLTDGEGTVETGQIVSAHDDSLSSRKSLRKDFKKKYKSACKEDNIMLPKEQRIIESEERVSSHERPVSSSEINLRKVVKEKNETKSKQNGNILTVGNAIETKELLVPGREILVSSSGRNLRKFLEKKNNAASQENSNTLTEREEADELEEQDLKLEKSVSSSGRILRKHLEKKNNAACQENSNTLTEREGAVESGEQDLELEKSVSSSGRILKKDLHKRRNQAISGEINMLREGKRIAKRKEHVSNPKGPVSSARMNIRNDTSKEEDQAMPKVSSNILPKGEVNTEARRNISGFIKNAKIPLFSPYVVLERMGSETVRKYLSQRQLHTYKQLNLSHHENMNEPPTEFCGSNEITEGIRKTFNKKGINKEVSKQTHTTTLPSIRVQNEENASCLEAYESKRSSSRGEISRETPSYKKIEAISKVNSNIRKDDLTEAERVPCLEKGCDKEELLLTLKNISGNGREKGNQIGSLQGINKSNGIAKIQLSDIEKLTSFKPKLAGFKLKKIKRGGKKKKLETLKVDKLSIEMHSELKTNAETNLSLECSTKTSLGVEPEHLCKENARVLRKRKKLRSDMSNPEEIEYEITGDTSNNKITDDDLNYNANETAFIYERKERSETETISSNSETKATLGIRKFSQRKRKELFKAKSVSSVKETFNLEQPLPFLTGQRGTLVSSNCTEASVDLRTNLKDLRKKGRNTETCASNSKIKSTKLPSSLCTSIRGRIRNDSEIENSCEKLLEFSNKADGVFKKKEEITKTENCAQEEKKKDNIVSLLPQVSKRTSRKHQRKNSSLKRCNLGDVLNRSKPVIDTLYSAGTRGSSIRSVQENTLVFDETAKIVSQELSISSERVKGSSESDENIRTQNSSILNVLEKGCSSSGDIVDVETQYPSATHEVVRDASCSKGFGDIAKDKLTLTNNLSEDTSNFDEIAIIEIQNSAIPSEILRGTSSLSEVVNIDTDEAVKDTTNSEEIISIHIEELSHLSRDALTSGKDDNDKDEVSLTNYVVKNTSNTYVVDNIEMQLPTMLSEPIKSATGSDEHVNIETEELSDNEDLRTISVSGEILSIGKEELSPIDEVSSADFATTLTIQHPFTSELLRDFLSSGEIVSFDKKELSPTQKVVWNISSSSSIADIVTRYSSFTTEVEKIDSGFPKRKQPSVSCEGLRDVSSSEKVSIVTEELSLTEECVRDTASSGNIADIETQYLSITSEIVEIAPGSTEGSNIETQKATIISDSIRETSSSGDIENQHLVVTDQIIKDGSNSDVIADIESNVSSPEKSATIDSKELCHTKEILRGALNSENVDDIVMQNSAFKSKVGRGPSDSCEIAEIRTLEPVERLGVRSGEGVNIKLQESSNNHEVWNGLCSVELSTAGSLCTEFQNLSLSLCSTDSFNTQREKSFLNKDIANKASCSNEIVNFENQNQETLNTREDVTKSSLPNDSVDSETQLSPGNCEVASSSEIKEKKKSSLNSEDECSSSSSHEIVIAGTQEKSVISETERSSFTEVVNVETREKSAVSKAANTTNEFLNNRALRSPNKQILKKTPIYNEIISTKTVLIGVTELLRNFLSSNEVNVGTKELSISSEIASSSSSHSKEIGNIGKLRVTWEGKTKCSGSQIRGFQVPSHLKGKIKSITEMVTPENVRVSIVSSVVEPDDKSDVRTSFLENIRKRMKPKRFLPTVLSNVPFHPNSVASEDDVPDFPEVFHEPPESFKSILASYLAKAEKYRQVGCTIPDFDYIGIDDISVQSLGLLQPKNYELPDDVAENSETNPTSSKEQPNVLGGSFEDCEGEGGSTASDGAPIWVIELIKNKRACEKEERERVDNLAQRIFQNLRRRTKVLLELYKRL